MNVGASESTYDLHRTSRTAAGIIVQDQSSRRAIYAISLSMAAYVAGDAVLKLLGRSFPPSELIFWRSVVIAVSLGAVLAWTRPRLLSAAMVSGPVLTRCLFDCVNILSFTTAIIHMQLAELYAVLQISPLLIPFSPLSSSRSGSAGGAGPRSRSASAVCC